MTNYSLTSCATTTVKRILQNIKVTALSLNALLLHAKITYAFWLTTITFI